MSAQGRVGRVDLDRQISMQESRAVEDLATIRMLEEQWEDFRQVMRENTERFERASIDTGAENYFVQKGLAARRELDSFVGRLAYEQEELFAESAREIRSGSQDELERLRRERDAASWD